MEAEMMDTLGVRLLLLLELGCCYVSVCVFASLSVCVLQRQRLVDHADFTHFN